MKENLEKDIMSSFIADKIRSSVDYSQNLYAAFCNNVFMKNGEEWSCSWRYAGGVVASLRNEGDYIDWYCSGIMVQDTGYVEESVVTEEIANDLAQIGWSVRKD